MTDEKRGLPPDKDTREVARKRDNLKYKFTDMPVVV
jgi:hypothetical protein